MKTARYKPGEYIMNQYEVRQVLFGGMGIVYLCQDHKLGIPFALKTFPDEYFSDTEKINKFIQEASLWVKLGFHINIVQAERIEKVFDKPYVVAQCVIGNDGFPSPLSREIQRGSLSLAKSLDYGIQICIGMNYAATRCPGFIHRDLKPDNILLTVDGFAKITDFGISDIFRPTKKIEFSSDKIAGTPAYMAPELFEGNEPSIASDIFAFGGILYEMICGRNYKSILLTGDTKDIFENIQKDLIPILRKCLMNDSSLRYQSFYDLGVELDDIYTTIFKKQNAYTIHSQIIPGTWFIHKCESFKSATQLGIAMHEGQKAGVIPTTPHELRIGQSFMNLNKPALALKHFEKFISDESTAVISDKDLKNMGMSEEEYKEDQHNALASGYMHKGNALSCLGKGEDALSAYKTALSFNQNDQDVWYNMGEAYFNVLHDSKNAILAYEKAIKLKPDDDMAWGSIGFVYMENNEMHKAKKSFLTALELNPNLIQSLGNLASIYYEEENYTVAIELLKRLLKYEPSNSRAWFLLGNCYMKTGETNKINDCFKKASFYDPGNPMYSMFLGK